MRSSRINQLPKDVLFTAKEARAIGISPVLLSYYVNKGQLTRIGKGIYQRLSPLGSADYSEWTDLINVCHSVPHGVVCLITALSIYNLTDEIPREHWIAIPNSSKPPIRPQVRIVRMRNMTTGKTRIDLEAGKIAIFDRERTVLDTFRYMDKEIALKTLKKYLSNDFRGEKPNISKLIKYSKKLEIPIAKYLEALLV